MIHRVAMLLLLWAVVAGAQQGLPQELIVWGQGRDRGLDAALRQFEVEHPGWKIITTSGSSGGMDPQKLMTGIAGGAPPDLVKQDRFAVGEWAARDAFVRLDSFIAASLRGEALARQARSALAANDGGARGLLADLLQHLQSVGPGRQTDLLRRLQSAPSDALAEELVDLLGGIHEEQFFPACWLEACFGEGTRAVYTASPTALTTAPCTTTRTCWSGPVSLMAAAVPVRPGTGRNCRNLPCASRTATATAA